MSKKTDKPISDNNCCETMTKYPDHSKLLPNLNRIAGQIEGIKKMINDRRYCVDILQQFKSVKSAIGGVEAKMLEAHMDSCVTATFNSKNERDKLKKISELKDLYRRFNH
jgi:DNA-binding FrmR family transcriptional regulator